MIGFYSNAGYFKGTIEELKNISQITFLDVNTPYTIPILQEVPPESAINSNGGIGYNDLPNFYSDVVNRYYGPDWYLTYAAGWSASERSITSQSPADYIEATEEFRAVLPGMFVAWPNTIAFAERLYGTAEAGDYVYVLYITNLKRLFMYSGPYKNYQYRVDESGNITQIPNLSGALSPLRYSVSYVNYPDVTVSDIIVLKVPFTSYSVLRNRKNFFVLSINMDLSTYLPGTAYGANYAVGGFRELDDITAENVIMLFADADKVDFEGTNPPGPEPEPPGPSGPGGGGGTYDEISDPIEFPDPPALTAVDTGMISLYSPSIGQLRDLANYMWSDAFNLDTFKKLFADPMDVIIGLSMVPVQPTIGGIKTIVIGFVDTGVACSPVENQYVTVECGSLDIKEFFGTALDYSPYTKFSIYLPFIGTKELKTDDIMGKTITVRYTVDVLSGACTAHVKCGDSVLYQYSGSCANTIPITSQNWSQMITSIIQLAGAGIATAVSGGAAAPMIPAAANTVLSAKPTIQRAGAVSGAAGFLGIQYPYLIWEHPRQSLPTGYNRFVGYPSNITYTLGELSGFTQIESVHLEGIPATQNELIEIESLLKEGVIF